MNSSVMFMPRSLKDCVLLFVVVSAVLLTNTYQQSAPSVKRFIKFNDGRCLPTTISSLLNKTVSVDLQCAGMCNQLQNCSMFMVISSSKLCVLYSGMTARYYNAISYSSPGQCKIYSTGWGSCPYSRWSFEGKYYYYYPYTTTMWHALDVCNSQYQSLLKLDSLGELFYVNQAFISAGYDHLWLSLHGPSSNLNLTWLADGSTIAKSSIPSSIWSIDGCCDEPAPITCYFISVTGATGSITDNGCNGTTYPGHPLCTCQ